MQEAVTAETWCLVSVVTVDLGGWWDPQEAARLGPRPALYR